METRNNLSFSSTIWRRGLYDNPKDDLITNAYGTYLMACLAKKKIKCKKFIYTSTVAVYGTNKKKIIDEKTIIDPDSLYQDIKILR